MAKQKNDNSVKKSQSNSGFPSVLAIEKKIVPSDGVMYGTDWDNRYDNKKARQLKIVEKAVRGTKANINASEKDMIDPNPQVVDCCSLGEYEDTLKVSFTLKFLSGIENTYICNDPQFDETYSKLVNWYRDNVGFKTLAYRYAYNIANGRFLWRNRIGAEDIEIKITLKDPAQEIIVKAFDYSLRNFAEKDTEIIQPLVDSIAKVLSGEKDYVLIDVEAYARLGKLQEVYPSQELIFNQDKTSSNSEGKKSKVLYSTIDGVAGMHSQKIGNAIRTIDTWYNNDVKSTPIPVEIYGTVTTKGIAHRGKGNDFYTLFKNVIKDNNFDAIPPEEQHYIMAVLVRGGVFGESSKN